MGNTNIYHSNRKWLSSELGGENSLPQYHFANSIAKMAPDKNLPEKVYRNALQHSQSKMLPYLRQDKYDRSQKEATIPTIVLENDFLKATFYPQYGGRMTSLWDKKQNKELLFDNPVFQPANLAIRNAWFSGGIEWNGPVYGHTMQTCTPVYFATFEKENTQILRIYEFDRHFQSTWQVDFYLPNDSNKLWFHVTVRNLNDYEIPLFWWTNIAAPVNDDIRFIAKGDYYINHDQTQLYKKSFPLNDENKDISYATNEMKALSLFFVDEKPNNPWFTYSDKNGYGMYHIATNNLMGKKLWYFGSNQGGLNWMDILSQKDKGLYIEIQAGVTETQTQTLPLPGFSKMSWTECIGPIQCEKEKAHHKDYQVALNHTDDKLNEYGLHQEISPVHHLMSAWEELIPSTVISEGTAWGHIYEESCHYKIPGVLFSAPIKAQERPWKEILENNEFSKVSLDAEPSSWICHASWKPILEKSMKEKGETWLHHLHLATICLENKKIEEGAKHLEKSIALKPNFFAYRGLAIIEKSNKNFEKMDAYYQKSMDCSNQNSDLILEIISTYIANKFYDKLEKPVQLCPPEIADHEKISLAKAFNAFNKNNLEEAEKHLLREYTYLREGELTTSDLWYDIQIKKVENQKGKSLTDAEKEEIKKNNPPPTIIDFRMK